MAQVNYTLCSMAFILFVTVAFYVFGLDYAFTSFKIVKLKFRDSFEYKGGKEINKKKQNYKSMFKDVVLVMNFNYPFYDSMELLHELYDDVFGVVVACGPPDPIKTNHSRGPDILYNKPTEEWFYRYHCLTKTILQYPGYEGYFYSNDDVIINWWNLKHFDKTKLWESSEVDFRQPAYGDIISNGWMWWSKPFGIEACQKYSQYLEAMSKTKYTLYKPLLKNYLANGQGEARCGKGWTDIFYVPKKHAKNYVLLSNIAYKVKLISEIAVHNIMRSLDLVENIENINGTFLPDLGVWENNLKDFWRIYNTRLTIIHPIKLNSETDKDFMRTVVKNWIVNHKNTLLSIDEK